MMRLVEKNIKFVKRHEISGRTRYYYVSMKSNKVSDGRMFNVTSKEELPQAVQKFMDKHEEKIFESIHSVATDDIFVTYIYRA